LDKEKFSDLLWQASLEVGVTLTPAKLDSFWLYLQELLEWNRNFNLTAIRDTDDIVIKHFVDSLTPLPYLESSGALLDLGPGAGFPSIPMKIVLPHLEVHLVDASRKKVSFLKHIIRTLKLTGATATHGRIENLPPQEISFQTLISRAFLRFEQLLQLVSPILCTGNTLVAMLGPTTKEEQVQFEDHALVEGLELSRLISLELPLGRGGRTLLFFEKISF
jgi:16S rRNA (guanine527-N7)-methyltransferase